MNQYDQLVNDLPTISQQYDFSGESDYLTRKMFLDEHGPVTVQRFEEVKYPKIQDFESIMRGYYWDPEEIDLTKDRVDFKEVSDAAKHMFISNLLRQTSLDSGQGKTPALVFTPAVSLPEIEALCLTWSFFETCIHSKSYSHIIRNIVQVPKEEFDKIHANEQIVKMAASVGKYYTNLHRLNCAKELGIPVDLRTHKKAVYMALHASYALEALRFMVSFATSLAMAENKMFIGNGNVISLILQDELVHTEFTEFILKRLERDDPDYKSIAIEMQEEVYQMYMDVIREEKDWADYLFMHGAVIGLNAQILKDFVDYTAWIRLDKVGIKYRHPHPKTHPIPWFMKYVNINEKQTALQENESTDYVIGLVTSDVNLDELPNL